MIKKLKVLKKKYYISSFQTRNIPHYGHEKIIKSLMKKKGRVIINPLIGMKKKVTLKMKYYQKFLKIYYQIMNIKIRFFLNH